MDTTESIYPLFYMLTAAVRGHRGLKPIPAVTGQQLGYTLEMWLFYQGA